MTPSEQILTETFKLREATAHSDEVARHLRGLILQHHHPLVSEVSVLAETATLLNHATQHFERVAKPKLTPPS